MAHRNAAHIPYAPTDVETIYPESDGKPLAETERHLRQIIRTLNLLEPHFAEVPDAYVWSNMMVFYEKGPPPKFVKPDIFVAFGVGKHERRIYQVWVEGKPPDFVMEFASKGTYENDLSNKKDIYAAMGIQEYFLYDPYRLYLPSPLLGFHLVNGSYVAIPPLADGYVPSKTLGLEFFLLPDAIGIADAATGKRLQTQAEKEAEARQKAEARAQREAEARQNAEAELAKLREQLKRLENSTSP